MKILKTIIVTILLLFFAISFSGGGHGTYLPAQIIYPYTMIIAKLQFEIGFFALLLALIEIPVYGYIWFNKPNWKYYILGIHMLGVLISFLIKSEVFN
ncbi:MAG TPA: hypothetical protein VJ304_02130 [Flavobacterium sp.]|nr:hypothetical protein [Flavobacterium sp.]